MAGEPNNGRITSAVLNTKLDNLIVLVGELSKKLDREIESTSELEKWASASQVRLEYLDRKSTLWDVGNTLVGAIAIVVGAIFGTRKL